MHQANPTGLFGQTLFNALCNLTTQRGTQKANSSCALPHSTYGGGNRAPFFLIAEIQLLITLGVALAEGFEEDDARGYAYVEGFDRAGCGQGDYEVATLAG